MGFSSAERDDLEFKLAAGVFDGAETAQWYDSQVPYVPAILNKNVLTEFDQIPEASTIVTARANAVSKPSLIQDLSQNTSAVRLSVISGTSNSTFAASSTYGNLGELTRLRNWIHPTKVPRSNGAPSLGYGVRLFQGNPAAGGTEILPASGLTGSGSLATPAWLFNYDQGILLVSADYRTTLSNPYILGFRYIGKTLSDTIATIATATSVVVQSSLVTVTAGNTVLVDISDTTKYGMTTWDVVVECQDNRIRKSTVSAVHTKGTNLIKYTIFGSVGSTIGLAITCNYNSSTANIELKVQNKEATSFTVSVLKYPAKRV